MFRNPLATGDSDRETIFLLIISWATALLLLVGASIGSYLIMCRHIQSEASNSATISLSAGQRMYSQRVALLSLSLVSARDPALKERLREELQSIIRTMESALSVLSSSPEMSDTVRAMYFSTPLLLDDRLKRFFSETRNLVSKSSGRISLDDSSLLYLTAASTELMRDLELLTNQYRSEGVAGVLGLSDIERSLLIFTLSLLVIAAGGIFYPMTRRLALELRRRTQARQDLSELTEQLKDHSLKLERSNSELEQFANIVAHDLKAPARNISAFAEIIANRMPAQADEQFREFIGHIKDASRRMQNLIGDLLMLGRVTSNKHMAVEVDLLQLLDEITTDLSAVLSEAGVTIEGETLPVILGDRTQLRQLFQNLIQNSMKFKHPERECKIIVRGSDTNKDDWFEVVVEDNGIGFNPEDKERIFAVFERLHSFEEYEGTGLGLTICRRIMERHGGSITAEGAVNCGAAMRMSFPGRSICALRREKFSKSPEMLLH